MGLVTDFENDLPLNAKKLEAWIKTALTEIEKSKTYTFDNINFTAIMNKSEGNRLNDVLSVNGFNSMFNAVKDKNTLKLTIGDYLYTIPTASVNEVTSDDYKYVSFVLIGKFTDNRNMQCMLIGLEMLDGDIRLADKDITTL